ncbi:hypothetical protein SOCEGT47_040100 [Sorangium cellulosum]|uniref:Uncharacterized protein n=1 Tax=Sorangium cellulosum TaxID=56 RepID=A0A4P2Q2J1_SORCE|nr:tetratricopeptide repeat protein [Sorangium cellulosum]AUX23484.1 hypothetical protein SOCEGT47_040100 [Sorangium cellulosum]
MTNLTARLRPSSGPEGRRVQVCFACWLTAAALWASPARAAQEPLREALGSPRGMPVSPAAAQPSPGQAPAPPASPPPSPDGAQSEPEAAEKDPEAEERRRRIERATALHDAARALYQRGAYRAAIAKLEAAVALDPEGKELIYNLAVIHERLGQIEQAEHYYVHYLAMETLPKEREEVAAVLKRLQGAKRELASAPTPAEAASPQVRYEEAPPLRPTVAAVRASPLSAALLVSGGVAAGALVAGGVFAALAVARDPGAGARTGGGVSIADLQADATAAHTWAVAADIALLGAGLSGVAALCLYLSPRAPAASSQAARPASAARRAPLADHGGALRVSDAWTGEGGPGVRVLLGAGGAGLQVRF